AGGGETGIPDLDDAIAANAALKESEMVALARLERVEFLYREMKKKAYTELLKDGAVNRSTVKGFQKYTSDMARTVESLEKTFGPLLDTLTELKDSTDGTAEATLAADPVLLMLHRALREDMDFVRILAEGRKGDIPLRERIARKLVDIPLDEKDIVVWRRLHAAQTQVITEQQDALSGMQQMPDMLRDLKETLLVVEAERETDTVPRVTHDEAINHLDGLQTELVESREKQEALTTENEKLKKDAQDSAVLQENIDILHDRLAEKDSDLHTQRTKRGNTLQHMRAYGRKMRAELATANELVAALQTGDLQNVIETLKQQGTLNDSERAENEKLVKRLEYKIEQKDAELKILQERINLWVTEHDAQEERIRDLQQKSAIKYSIGAAFAAAACGVGIIGANSFNAFIGTTAIENPTAMAVVGPALVFGAIGGLIGAVIGAVEDGLKGTIIGGTVGTFGVSIVTGLLFAIPAGLLSDWADNVSEKYCPATGCEMIQRNTIQPPQATIRQENGKTIIELAPAPAP
ncbi:MAG: hypothetical protein KKA05_00840, partial [Alphaproteobacteria bacterium]|nr:hypothetical protein [Alphaproteobacteria bacterium]